RFDSIIQLTHNDPIRQQIDILTPGGWFTEAEQRGRHGGHIPVFISDVMAHDLGIRANEVNEENVTVLINGRTFTVKGIFSAESLKAVRDLDNHGILPYDIEGMAKIHVRQDFEVI